MFFIPCEHGSGNRPRILSFIKSYSKKNSPNENHIKKLKNIDKIFVPSGFYKNILLEQNLFSDDKILVSGTINSDLWFKNISNFLSVKILIKKKLLVSQLLSNLLCLRLNMKVFKSNLFNK